MRTYRLAIPILFACATLAQTPPPAANAPATPPAGGRGGPQGPNTDVNYKLAPDAVKQEGVPQGEMRGPFTLPSEAYPGTQHTYWVYVPAQYDPKVPASLMIYNDGQAFKYEDGDIRAQVVMDNLIYRRELPVMIGVFHQSRTAPRPARTNPEQLGRSRHEPPDRVQHAR